MTSQVVINDVIPRTQIVSSSGQLVFNTNWTADATSDILVYARISGIPANDQTQLVSSSNYNVAFVGSSETVRVTFIIPRTSGDIITISRDTPASRTNLYTNTNFTPSMLNQDFGVLTLVDQQAQMYDEQLAPHYNISASFTDPNDLAIDLILPILVANQFWVKNAANTGFTIATLGSGDLPSASPLVTYGPDSSLTNAFDLGALTDGILAQTVTAGFSTPYILDLPLEVEVGGTGLDEMIAYSILLGGTTTTGSLQQVSTVGVLGQTLVSQGPGAKPIWASSGLVNIQYISASGTYTPTAGANRAVIEVIGGGGGSGGCAATSAGQSACSSGGGGGGYARIYVTSLTATAVTIGAGGIAATAGNATGGTGGSTAFGSIVSATGGAGGAGSPAGTGGFANTGGAGGTGVGGDINLIGGDGGIGQVLAASQVSCAYFGGASQLAGQKTGSTAPASPVAGHLYGGGAAGQYLGGSHAASAGAAGAAGICIVTEFS